LLLLAPARAGRPAQLAAAGGSSPAEQVSERESVRERKTEGWRERNREKKRKEKKKKKKKKKRGRGSLRLGGAGHLQGRRRHAGLRPQVHEREGEREIVR